MEPEVCLSLSTQRLRLHNVLAHPGKLVIVRSVGAQKPSLIMRRLLLAFLLVLVFRPADAQELNCSVSLDFRSLSGAQYTFLNDLRRDIEEYYNERSWTEERYTEQERIDCTVQITVEEALSLSSFRGRIVVASRRPIYGTSQNTTIVQFSDPSFQFNYTQGQPLTYNPERYDPLTSVLDFYAMLVLGYDYDTFHAQGGTPFFERARRIAELAQAQNAPGWIDLGSERGRADLIRQLLDARMRPLRDAYFTYHFNGLDHFVLETDAARESVMEVLRELHELTDMVARQYAVDLFFNAKFQELTAIFEGSQIASQAYDLLAQVDPSHTSEYDRLVR